MAKQKTQINWKSKFEMLEWETMQLREKVEANISLFKKILGPMLRKNGRNLKQENIEFRHISFDNQDRSRYYGLRCGDLVDYRSFGFKHKNCIVVDYIYLDNNKVVLQTEDGERFPAVAEWCEIKKKIGELNEKN